MFMKCPQTNAAVRSRMEGPNIDPFLDKPSSSRGLGHIISARVFMLFLSYYAHQQEQPEYQKPQPGSVQYDIEIIYGESSDLGGGAARIWNGGAECD